MSNVSIGAAAGGLEEEPALLEIDKGAEGLVSKTTSAARCSKPC